MRTSIYLYITILGLILSSCTSGIETENKKILVSSEITPCGNGPLGTDCYLVKWSLDQEEWEVFSNPIKGFKYEAGYEYELEIRVSQFENSSKTNTAIGYRLVQILAKVEVENESDNQHNSQNSLDWEGSYVSVLPCADCEGIKTILTIKKDGTFVRTEIYLGKNGKKFEYEGKFEWDKSGNKITLLDQRRNQQYKVEENKLIHLDDNGKVITGSLSQHYVLEKKSFSIEDRNWKLISFLNKEIKGDAKEYFIFFQSSENKVQTRTGCNLLFSTYELGEKSNIKFRRFSSTRMQCRDETLEEEYLMEMVWVDNYSLSNDGNKLQLKIGENTVAIYEVVE